MAGYTMSRYFLPGVCELPAALIANGDDAAVLASLKAAKAEGAVLAVIVPSSEERFSTYRKLGFSEFFMIERSPVKLKLLGKADERIVDLPADRAPECNDMMFQVAQWRGHLMRTPQLWLDAAEGVRAQGGGVIAARREGAIAGYALYRPTDGRAVIDELFCEDEPAFIALQRAALERCGAEEGILCAPACPHGAERFGMVRALDFAALLDAASKRRPGDVSVEVEDRQLGESARYGLADGKVVKSERTGVFALGPGEFAAILLGGGPAPYVNLVFC